MNEPGKSLRVDPTLIEALFGREVRNGPVAAERELMVAVLEDAIECFRKYSMSRAGVGPRLFDEAKVWLFTDDERQPFSFLNICEALRLDPGYIRRGILAWNTQRTPGGETDQTESGSLGPQAGTLISPSRRGAKSRRTAKVRRRFPA